MMSPAAEVLIQQATDRVGYPKHLEPGCGQTDAAAIWTPSYSKSSSTACKVPGFHAKRVGWNKLRIGPPPIPPSSPNKELPKLQVQGLLHSSPLGSP